jgi:hypothetical protein
VSPVIEDSLGAVKVALSTVHSIPQYSPIKKRVKDGARNPFLSVDLLDYEKITPSTLVVKRAFYSGVGGITDFMFENGY